MKSFIFIIFSLFSTLTYSQIKEGYFQYTIDVEAIDTLLKTKQAVGMLRNSKMEFYFTENKSRMDFKMGQINDLTIIVDLTQDKVLSLNSSMMGKVAMIDSAENIQVSEKDSTIKVVFTEETKKILGYTCKKSILIQGNTQVDYWVTDEIKIDKRIQQITNPNVPGFPMKFSKIEAGVLMTYEMSNIRKKVEGQDILFSLEVPEGYQMIQPNK